MSLPQATLQLLIQLFEDSQTVSRFAICSIGLLVYDHILTLPDEITYVWYSHWSIGKILFFLTRYSPYIDAGTGLAVIVLDPPPSLNVCKSLIKATSWSQTFGTLVAKAILLLRTRAIWSNDNRIFIPLLIIYILFLVGGAVPLAMFLHSQLYIPLNIWPHCQVYSRNSVIVWPFVCGLIFETIVMVFTGIKAFQHWRLDSRDLLYVVYRDGLLFYVYFVLMGVASVALLVSFQRALGGVMTFLMRILSAILSARLLINMRKAAVSARMKTGSTTIAPSEMVELTTLNETIVCDTSGNDDWEDGRGDVREFESVSWWMGEESVVR